MSRLSSFASRTTYLWLAIALICPVSTGLGAIDDLLRVIPSPNAPDAGWGGVLEPVSATTVLIGIESNYGRNDAPVKLVDVLTGEIIQSYAEPASNIRQDKFGTSVIQVGNYVLVGAYGTDLEQPTGEDAGLVHVYDAATGAYQRMIRNPNPSSSGSFGISMAPVGNLAVIGTFEDLSSNGAAYLVDPATGDIVTKFENPTGNRQDNFGSTVASMGSDVLIATRNTSHVYRFDSVTGQLKQTYTHPNGASASLFGFDLLTTGDKVIIGSFKDYLLAPEGGAVYAFDADTGALLSTFVSPTPSANDWFGFDMTMLGDNTLIVSEINDDSAGVAIGRVFAFDLASGELLAEIPNPFPQPAPQFERFGRAVAQVGGALVIGSPRGNFVADDGPVYVYEGLIPEPSSLTMLIVFSSVCIRRSTRSAM